MAHLLISYSSVQFFAVITDIVDSQIIGVYFKTQTFFNRSGVVFQINIQYISAFAAYQVIVFLDPVIAVRLSFNTDDPYITLFKQGIQIIVDGGQHHFISSFLKNPEDIFR